MRRKNGSANRPAPRDHIPPDKQHANGASQSKARSRCERTESSYPPNIYRGRVGWEPDPTDSDGSAAADRAVEARGTPTMTSPTGARATWPRCRAFARTTGKPCRAAGDGVHGLCRHHTGLVLRRGWREPLPIWELRIMHDGIWVSPDRPARTSRKPSWPQRVSWSAAVRLVTSAQIARAVIHRTAGAAFLVELERCGVGVIDKGTNVPLVRRIAFLVSDVALATRLAKRRMGDGHG